MDTKRVKRSERRVALAQNQESGPVVGPERCPPEIKGATPDRPQEAPIWTPKIADAWRRVSGILDRSYQERKKQLEEVRSNIRSWEKGGRIHLLGAKQIKLFQDKRDGKMITTVCYLKDRENIVSPDQGLYAHLHLYLLGQRSKDVHIPLKLSGKAWRNRIESVIEYAEKAHKESLQLLNAMGPDEKIDQILRSWTNKGANLAFLQRAYLGLLAEMSGYLPSLPESWYRPKRPTSSPGKRGRRPNPALDAFIKRVGDHLRDETGRLHTTELTDLLDHVLGNAKVRKLRYKDELGFDKEPDRSFDRRFVKTRHRYRHDEENPRGFIVEVPLH